MTTSVHGDAPPELARRQRGPRRGSSGSPCSGRGCRTAPRERCSSVGAGSWSSRSVTATTRPGVQNPHCTAPASTNACCTGGALAVLGQVLHGADLARRRPARPGPGTSRPARRRARPSTTRTRPARRRSSSRAGRGARGARRAGSSPGQTSASRHSPLTVVRTSIAVSPSRRRGRCAPVVQGPRQSARRAEDPAAWRRYAAVPRTSSIGRAAAATRSAELLERARRGAVAAGRPTRRRRRWPRGERLGVRRADDGRGRPSRGPPGPRAGPRRAPGTARRSR